MPVFQELIRQCGLMRLDWVFLELLARFFLINIVPFFLVFHLVVRRRDQRPGRRRSELVLTAKELQTVGLLGYYVILSIFFFSIPVLKYLNTKPGYDILLIAPDNYTVFIISVVSFSLVVCSVYLQGRRRWAWDMAFYLVSGLLCYSFFAVLEWGAICIVPVSVFAYLLFRLTRPGLRADMD